MRTILFSFSSEPVFKNLFFFEGSVFEKISDYTKNHADTRCVFVMPPGYEKKYAEALAPRLHERCIVETVPYPKLRTLLQRLLHFFYSYFVYTGTTAVMATIGIRPDEPPAGGYLKKYLGPVKWFLSRTFGRSRWARDTLVPFLYYKIYPQNLFIHLFEKYHPDLVFVPNLYGNFDTRFLAEAKKAGIKTMGMGANWDHFDKYFLPFKPDTLLIQSNQMKRFAVKHQRYDPATIQMTGYPYFDFIVKKGSAMPREEVLRHLGLPTDARYLVYASGSAYCRDEPEIVEEILKWIDEGKIDKNLYMVIRPYAGVRPADRDVDEEKFGRFKHHPRVRIFKGAFWGDRTKSHLSMNILHKAEVVLVVYSTMTVEAASLGRPVIAPTFDGWQNRPFNTSIRRFEIREHFADILQSGGLRQAYNFQELLQHIRAYLEDPSLDREGRIALCREVCHTLDGKSSERVFNQIINAL